MADEAPVLYDPSTDRRRALAVAPLRLRDPERLPAPEDVSELERPISPPHRAAGVRGLQHAVTTIKNLVDVSYERRREAIRSLERDMQAKPPAGSFATDLLIECVLGALLFGVGAGAGALVGLAARRAMSAMDDLGGTGITKVFEATAKAGAKYSIDQLRQSAGTPRRWQHFVESQVAGLDKAQVLFDFHMNQDVLPRLEQTQDVARAYDTLDREWMEHVTAYSVAFAAQRAESVRQWLRLLAKAELGSIAPERTTELEPNDVYGLGVPVMGTDLTAVTQYLRWVSDWIKPIAPLASGVLNIDVTPPGDVKNQRPLTVLGAKLLGVPDAMRRELAGRRLGSLDVCMRVCIWPMRPVHPQQQAAAVVSRNEFGTVFLDAFPSADWLGHRAAMYGRPLTPWQGARAILEDELGNAVLSTRGITIR